ncbi:MAG: metallophosphoesterase family protein [Polyangiales bacterium]
MSTPDDRARTESVRGPMAFLADIHGNLAALDAVLAELREAGARNVYVAGDLLLGGDDPAGVWRRLQEVDARCVRGPSDLALATLDPARVPARTDDEKRALARFAEARAALGELALARLRRLPLALRIELPDQTDVLVVHGTPRDPDTYFTPDLSDEEMESLLADDPADFVLCGGSHVPFARALDAVNVISIGSVGECPDPGVACFALLRPTASGPVFEPRHVRYR